MAFFFFFSFHILSPDVCNPRRDLEMSAMMIRRNAVFRIVGSFSFWILASLSYFFPFRPYGVIVVLLCIYDWAAFSDKKLC